MSSTKVGVTKAKNGKLAQEINQTILAPEKRTLPSGYKPLFESLAKDKFFHRNYFFDCLARVFPHENMMWYTDRYYPYADGGPLAIDDGGHKDDLETLKLKKQHLKAIGVRYILITPEMTEMQAVEDLSL